MGNKPNLCIYCNLLKLFWLLLYFIYCNGINVPDSKFLQILHNLNSYGTLPLLFFFLHSHYSQWTLAAHHFWGEYPQLPCPIAVAMHAVLEVTPMICSQGDILQSRRTFPIHGDEAGTYLRVTLFLPLLKQHSKKLYCWCVLLEGHYLIQYNYTDSMSISREQWFYLLWF